MARQLHADCRPRAAATGMSEICLWSWGAPEISPPPAICKPGILRAAPPESTLRLSHFLGLEHNISHISTTRPVARCFSFLPVSGLGRAAGYLRRPVHHRLLLLHVHDQFLDDLADLAATSSGEARVASALCLRRLQPRQTPASGPCCWAGFWRHTAQGGGIEDRWLEAGRVCGCAQIGQKRED